MAVVNGYTDVLTVKATLNIQQSDDDGNVEAAIEAASRQIDQFCRRRFYVDTEDETAYFTGRGTETLWLGPAAKWADLTEVTSVNLQAADGAFSETLTVDVDYYLAPRTSQLGSYTKLVRIGGCWPRTDVQVAGKFGAVAPPEVVEATIMQASRLFKRATEAPMGSAMVTMDSGSTLIRPSRYLDGDVEQLLTGHRLHPVAVA